MSFVKRKTIWNAVGGGFSNPVHTATYIRRD